MFSLFKRLWLNSDGLVLIKTALMMVPVIGMLGLGIDLSRFYLYRSHLSGALDAAALAGGKAFHSQTRDDEIRSYFYANFDKSFMNGNLENLTINEIDGVEKTLVVAATGEIGTTFMSMFGFEDVEVFVEAEVTSKTTGLQLVMVLDTTGSMSNSAGGGISRIQALRNSANTLVDSLFGDNSSSENLEIAVVPYVTSVNVGHLLDPNYVDFDHPIYDPDHYGVNDTNNRIPSTYRLDRTNPARWHGCVEARETNSSLNSSAYDIRVGHDGMNWAPYLWTPGYDENSVYGIDGLYGPYKADPTRLTDWSSGDAPNNRQYTGQGGSSSYDQGPNLACPAPVLDFESSKSALSAYINSLNYAYGRGGTISSIGMMWGWRLLHTGEPFSNQVAYDDPLTVKAAILMTDGENWVIGNTSRRHPHYDGSNTSSDNGDDIDDDGDGRCPQCSGTYQDRWGRTRSNARYDGGDEARLSKFDFDGDYSGYGRRDEGRLDGATSTNGTTTAINRRLAAICAGMKGVGITVYTITFGSSVANNTSLQNLYEGCATDNGKYFHAPSASQLEGAFAAIANDLSNLRLSR